MSALLQVMPTFTLFLVTAEISPPPPTRTPDNCILMEHSTNLLHEAHSKLRQLFFISLKLQVLTELNHQGKWMITKTQMVSGSSRHIFVIKTMRVID